jgi:hypothetical protein
MTNQLVLFGNKHEPNVARWWRFGSPRDGELLYCVEGPVRTDSADTNLDSIRCQVIECFNRSGGIVLETTRPSTQGAKLRIASANQKSFSAPQRALAVGLTGFHRSIDLVHNKEYQLDHYETVLVPAARNLEKKLFAFIESLDNLPPDHRTALLYTLVLPTYENRLASLEAWARTKNMARSESHPRGHSSTRGLNVWNVALVAGVVATLISLGAFSWYVSNKFSDITEQLRARQPAAGVTQGEMTDRPARSEFPSRNENLGNTGITPRAPGESSMPPSGEPREVKPRVGTGARRQSITPQTGTEITPKTKTNSRNGAELNPNRTP